VWIHDFLLVFDYAQIFKENFFISWKADEFIIAKLSKVLDVVVIDPLCLIMIKIIIYNAFAA